LTITSFTDELQPAIEIFEERYDVTVDLQIIPHENYTTTLRPALESGKGAPDIFTGELAFLKQWTAQDYWETLSQDPYNVGEWESDYVDYVWDLGKNDEGDVKAVSWQITPGGIYYRRSIALEVLGTDDPAEVGKRFSTMEGLLEVGEVMKEHNYRLFPDEGSICLLTISTSDRYLSLKPACKFSGANKYWEASPLAFLAKVLTLPIIFIFSFTSKISFVSALILVFIVIEIDKATKNKRITDIKLKYNFILRLSRTFLLLIPSILISRPPLVISLIVNMY